jgi:hypothetical protein
VAELSRGQAMVLLRWGPERLRYAVRVGKVHAYQRGRFFTYDPAELWQVSPEAREALGQLLRFSPRAEAGTHWSQAFTRWRDLEDAGLIRVHRPVHPATGIQYSQEYWDAELTDQGKEVVEYLQQLLEDGHLE